jgi:hypothetical protein
MARERPYSPTEDLTIRNIKLAENLIEEQEALDCGANRITSDKSPYHSQSRYSPHDRQLTC